MPHLGPHSHGFLRSTLDNSEHENRPLTCEDLSLLAALETEDRRCGVGSG